MEKLKEVCNRLLVDKKTSEQKQIICKIEKNEDCDSSKLLTDKFIVKPLTNVLFSPEIYRDIEFWDGVFKNVNRSQLQGGTHFTKSLMSSPCKDVATLQKRQAIIKDCEAKFDDGISVNATLEKLKALEPTVLWSFQELDENLEDLYNMAFFKSMFLKKFNDSPGALTGYNLYRILASPMIGLLSPIIYFLVPYLIVVFKFKIKIGFKDYLKLFLKSLMSSSELLGAGAGNAKYKAITMLSYVFSILFYFQGIFNSFELSRTLYKITKHLTNKTNQIVEFLHESTDMISKYWSADMAEMFGCGDNLKTLEEEVKYVQALKVSKFGLFQNFGKQLKTYKGLAKDIIKSILYKTYILDTIAGVVAFKNEYLYCYTEFVENAKPIMKLENIRHPSIDKDKCVSNSLTIGGNAKPNNAIITGTNAGGKSVLIKSVLINALLSQTCCVSCCDNAAITPFAHLNSQINVPDMTGHESLFQAEMHRCKNNLDCLKNLQLGNEHSLIVMDEIFSSTNPLEAISGAYAVCKKMSECENNLLIFTTHFNYLTKLKKTKKFLNYKMETLIEPDGEINFTYRLIPGINKQYLALELLKKNGFDQDIIDEALKIKAKFV